MTFETFQPRKFQAKTMLMIDEINAIIHEYMAKDFRLTVRQVHYQRVARGFKETKASIANKLARESLPAAFFLACLAAMELEGVVLEEI
jgi:Domain of unknown function (DUF6471)